MILGAIGFIILVYAFTDLLWTCFLEGGAPLTTRICSWLVRVMVAIQCRARRRPSRRVISSAGLVAVLATVAIWGSLIWAGWTLVFSAAPGAIIASEDHAPADLGGRIVFVGETIFTLGLGDYRPIGRPWQFLTTVAAGSGFILFGLALSYLVPIVAAATQKRQLALCIWSLGKEPTDILIRAWNGVDTTALSPHLVSLVPMLALLGENHLTYPALHYFHSSKRSSSAAPNIAALDEALTILECGLQEGCSLDLPSLGAARESISEFLNTLAPALIFPARDPPPAPSLQPLREVGVPAVDDALFHAALNALAERRRLLLALVQNEGWTWEAVWPAVEPRKPEPIFPPADAAPVNATSSDAA